MKKFLVVTLLCFLSIYGIYSQSDQDGLIPSDSVSQSEQVNLNPNNEFSQSDQNKVVAEAKPDQADELIKEDEGLKIIDIAIYVALIISFFLNIFLILKFRSEYNRNNNSIKNTNNDNTYSTNLSQINSKLQYDIKSLNDQITSLKNENNKQREMQISEEGETILSNKENFIEDVKATTIELEVKNEKNSANIIFLPEPFEECRFSVEDSSETQKQESIYKIEYNPKNNTGSIKLIEKANLSRALNSPNTFLETVCEYQNTFNINAKGISVVSNGEVVLMDKDWVVTKKIKIKFI